MYLPSNRFEGPPRVPTTQLSLVCVTDGNKKQLQEAFSSFP